MISEGPCGTENWSNDELTITGINSIFELFLIVTIFYNITVLLNFDQINAALLRLLSKMLLNGSVF